MNKELLAADTNHWITGPLMLEVFYSADVDMPPLIVGITGPVCTGSIVAIEQSLLEELVEGDLFKDGLGSYYIRCLYNRAQKDGYGRVECPAHWEFSRVGFMALPTGELSPEHERAICAEGGQGG